MSQCLGCWGCLKKSVLSSLGQREREPRHMSQGALWFFMYDQTDNMEKWDGKPTFELETHVYELRGENSGFLTAQERCQLCCCRDTRRQSVISKTEELRSPPLILVRRLLVWHCNSQTMNTLNRKKRVSAFVQEEERDDWIY